MFILLIVQILHCVQDDNEVAFVILNAVKNLCAMHDAACCFS